MTCRELVEFLSDYLSQELAPPVRGAFEEHIRECEDCERYLAGFAATVELTKDAFADPDAPVPDEVPEELVTAVLNARRRSES